MMLLQNSVCVEPYVPDEIYRHSMAATSTSRPVVVTWPSARHACAMFAICSKSGAERVLPSAKVYAELAVKAR